MNKTIVVGNLTRDIELKYISSGVAIANGAIATGRKFKNKQGQLETETCFIDLTFFGRTAEIANEYLARGSKVLIEGRLKFEQWVNQNGDKRSKHSVVVENIQMLDKKETIEKPKETTVWSKPDTTPDQANVKKSHDQPNSSKDEFAEERPF